MLVGLVKFVNELHGVVEKAHVEVEHKQVDAADQGLGHGEELELRNLLHRMYTVALAFAFALFIVPPTQSLVLVVKAREV